MTVPRPTTEQLRAAYRRLLEEKPGRQVLLGTVDTIMENLRTAAHGEHDYFVLLLKHNCPLFWAAARRTGVTSTNELVLILREDS